MRKGTILVDDLQYFRAVDAQVRSHMKAQNGLRALGEEV